MDHHLTPAERKELVQAARDAGAKYPHSQANLMADVIESIMLRREAPVDCAGAGGCAFDNADTCAETPCNADFDSTVFDLQDTRPSGGATMIRGLTAWLYRRATRCRVLYATQDPYDMTCSRHSFRTESLSALQQHMLDEQVVTAKALAR